MTHERDNLADRNATAAILRLRRHLGEEIVGDAAELTADLSLADLAEAEEDADVLAVAVELYRITGAAGPRDDVWAMVDGLGAWDRIAPRRERLYKHL